MSRLIEFTGFAGLKLGLVKVEGDARYNPEEGQQSRGFLLAGSWVVANGMGELVFGTSPLLIPTPTHEPPSTAPVRSGCADTSRWARILGVM